MTQPSLLPYIEIFLGWMMCLGKQTEYAVVETIQADTPISREQQHLFDRFYKSAWTVKGLAHGS
ncbi:MAG: hypothetical protein QGF59_03760 [Pirellulaceae bacterium]|nr:hypothetical protein [Pirellulaceae bacterium]